MKNNGIMKYMMTFASGIGMGLMYSKYERKINRYIKSMINKVNI